MTKKETMIDRTKHQYEVTRFVDKAGKTRTSLGNGDAVAKAMLGLDPDAVVRVMKKNGLEDKLGRHVGKVNSGQFRMFVGNALRGKVRRGEEVVVGDLTIKSLDQRVAVPEASARKAGNGRRKKAA